MFREVTAAPPSVSDRTSQEDVGEDRTAHPAGTVLGHVLHALLGKPEMPGVFWGRQETRALGSPAAFPAMSTTPHSRPRQRRARTGSWPITPHADGTLPAGSNLEVNISVHRMIEINSYAK